ncbi:polyamine oxidase 1-like [Miscanthus floridulus]|uniref:polyamine oxidase 1-like n=1 Tax=Miscanthus floridulus TaxID=154761 RepID=UPI003457FAAA
MGATWIQGIDGSPMYALARDAGALACGNDHPPYERMDGFPERVLMVAEGEYRDFPGDHVTIPGGYSRVVDHLVAALLPGTVRPRLGLLRLNWSETPCAFTSLMARQRSPPTTSSSRCRWASSRRASARMPTPRGGVAFDPPLLQFKCDAVARLFFGVVDKLFMELEAVPAAKPEGGGGGGGQPLAACAPPEFPFLHMAWPTGAWWESE